MREYSEENSYGLRKMMCRKMSFHHVPVIILIISAERLSTARERPIPSVATVKGSVLLASSGFSLCSGAGSRWETSVFKRGISNIILDCSSPLVVSVDTEQAGMGLIPTSCKVLLTFSVWVFTVALAAWRNLCSAHDNELTSMGLKQI